MSEQLWFTWSLWGFGTASGTRVRAASRGFKNERGQVDVQGNRFQSFMKHLNYTLPIDTVDPYTVDPQKTPRSLIFTRIRWKSGEEEQAEWVLINKSYYGLEDVGRAGGFFSHLLTGLPPVALPQQEGQPARQIRFSAREAISMWQSSFWKDKEAEKKLDPNTLELPQIASNELTFGPLSVEQVAQVSAIFSRVLRAFLTLPSLGPDKRLFIAASPDTVAALIWGITHALPRTLTLMRNLSFSTYEHSVDEKTLAAYGSRPGEYAPLLIIGTCWFSPLSPTGRNTAAPDLPLAYYQPDNPYGLAINCFVQGRATPLPDTSKLMHKFIEFATKAFQENLLTQLTEVVDEAEKRNVTEVPDFLNIFASLQQTLTKEEIIAILSNLLAKVKEVIEQARRILEQWNPTNPLEMPQWERLKLETKVLKRENVRRSILHWMNQDPAWWQDQCQPLLNKLHKLADGYQQEALVDMGTRFSQDIIKIPVWRNDKGQSVSAYLRQFLPNQTEDNPKAILTSFAQVVVNTIYLTEEDLALAFIPFAQSLTSYVRQAIERNEATQAFYWADALTTATPLQAEVEVWTTLLQQFATPGMGLTPAYQQWWTQYGKKQLTRLRPLVDHSPDSDLARAFSVYSQKAGTELKTAINSGSTQSLSSWEEVLVTVAPYTSEPGLWQSLLHQLWSTRFTPAFYQWWQEQGKAATDQVRLSAEQNPQSQLAQSLFAFLQEVAKELYMQIADATASPGNMRLLKRIDFLFDLLSIATPSTEPGIWIWLLQTLSPPAPQRIYDLYPWELRAQLLQAWARIAALRNVEPLREWFFIRWSELGLFLRLVLPDEWTSLVIARLVTTPPDISPQDIVTAVNLQAATFEVALQQLIKNPATQQAVIDFFTTLTTYGYPQRIKMLGGLIIASGYQPNIAEALFAAARLESNQEITDLLENNCRRLLEAYPLPPTLITYIRRYLSNFDISSLETSPTRDLLQRLQHRYESPELRLPDDLQTSIALWGTIAEFMERPEMSKNWLRDLREQLRGKQVLQFAPETRTKLTAVLLPALVAGASTEMDLVRVMDTLGQVLMGKGDRSELLLLERMTQIAGEHYSQERPLVHLPAYIKVILGEACNSNLPPAQKEEWMDRCLQALLKQFDTKTRPSFKNNPLLWPNDIYNEWTAYLARSGKAAIAAALKGFRTALQGRSMSDIVAAYNPILEKSLSPDESSRFLLAQRFMQAYDANDDAALVAAYQAIAGSQYGQQLRCTQEQYDRFMLAQNRLSASRAPAPLSSMQQHHAQPVQSLSSPTSRQQQSRLVLSSNHPQTSPAANQRSVAVVKGIHIYQGWFIFVESLKRSYIKFSINSLKVTNQQLERSNAREDKDTVKANKQDIQELEKLLRDDKQLRLATLNELVEDVLIQEAIAQIRQQKQSQGWPLDPEDDAQNILRRLRHDQGHANELLLANDNSTLVQILKGLCVFRRRELFQEYLYGAERTFLADWLKEHKRKEAASIQIDYDLAIVKQPKSGWLSF